LAADLAHAEALPRGQDLQLAAWLTEALVRRNRIAGLKDGLWCAA
jgi:predicted component of type VI protein secretion system